MDNKLRSLVDLRESLQDIRIAFGNRVDAIERGSDVSGNGSMELYGRWLERFHELEVQADADIVELSGEYPIVELMITVKGVGRLLASKVVAMVDIERADTISALWRYAGFGVKDGERERPVKGQPLSYNMKLKTTCYLIASSFLRCKSPYRQIYDQAKTYYEANRTDWTKLHIHLASMRKMTKHWLAHLWLVWRQLEGLPTRVPYVEEYLGHTTISKPADYGWIVK